MTITYFDKDGKEHTIKVKGPVYVAVQDEVTKKFTEVRIEQQRTWHDDKGYAMTDRMSVASANPRGMAILPAGFGITIMCDPDRKDKEY